MRVGTGMRSQPACAFSDPAFERQPRGLAHRHIAPAASLAQHGDLALVEIEPAARSVLRLFHVVHVETGELRQPQTRRIEQLEQRLITQRREGVERIVGRRRHQPRRLVRRQGFRKTLSGLRRAQATRRIGCDVAAFGQIVEESAPGGQPTGNRPRRGAGPDLGGNPATKIRFVERRPDAPVTQTCELLEIAPIGFQRTRRAATLRLQSRQPGLTTHIGRTGRARQRHRGRLAPLVDHPRQCGAGDFGNPVQEGRAHVHLEPRGIRRSEHEHAERVWIDALAQRHQRQRTRSGPPVRQP